MKWITKDMEMYIGAKEYVDTVIMPLVGISFQKGIKQSASANEFISILSQEAELQFKGRVLLLPTLTYASEWGMEQKKQHLLQWKQTLEEEGFPFIFFLTSDAEWKTIENELENHLLYIPSIPLESLDEKYKKPMMEEQVSELLTDISRKWRV